MSPHAKVDFPVHTRDTAPKAAHPVMDGFAATMGFVPNLVGILAGAPPALNAYAHAYAHMGETGFSPAEQQLLYLAVSRANACGYCVAAHTLGAQKAGLDDDIIDAVRDGRPVLDPKLAAIVDFATAVVDKRGFVSPLDVDNFLTAGHTREQIAEVILAVATKTISNYMNHIADTPWTIPWPPHGGRHTRRPSRRPAERSRMRDFPWTPRPPDPKSTI